MKRVIAKKRKSRTLNERTNERNYRGMIIEPNVWSHDEGAMFEVESERQKASMEVNRVETTYFGPFDQFTVTLPRPF